jgi:hypothetical protein
MLLKPSLLIIAVLAIKAYTAPVRDTHDILTDKFFESIFEHLDDFGNGKLATSEEDEGYRPAKKKRVINLASDSSQDSAPSIDAFASSSEKDFGDGSQEDISATERSYMPVPGFIGLSPSEINDIEMASPIESDFGTSEIDFIADFDTYLTMLNEKTRIYIVAVTSAGIRDIYSHCLVQLLTSEKYNGFQADDAHGKRLLFSYYLTSHSHLRIVGAHITCISSN